MKGGSPALRPAAVRCPRLGNRSQASRTATFNIVSYGSPSEPLGKAFLLSVARATVARVAEQASATLAARTDVSHRDQHPSPLRVDDDEEPGSTHLHQTRSVSPSACPGTDASRRPRGQRPIGTATRAVRHGRPDRPPLRFTRLSLISTSKGPKTHFVTHKNTARTVNTKDSWIG